jgi:hypothetical protein
LLQYTKIAHHQECLQRIGVNDKDFRICQKHDIITITKSVEYYNLKNEKIKVIVDMNVPVAYDATEITNARIESRAAGWRSKLDSSWRLSRLLQRQFGADKEQNGGTNTEQHQSFFCIGQ